MDVIVVDKSNGKVEFQVIVVKMSHALLAENVDRINLSRVMYSHINV